MAPLTEFMTPEERAAYEQLVLDREGAEPLRDFIARNFPHEPPPSHLGPLLAVLERARHERIKVCISWPPRHAKTVTVLRAIVWWLLHDSADTCAYYSYSDKQAWSKSRICRDWARNCGLELAQDAANVAEWHTSKGGALYAGGLRSGLTGRGVSGLFIVDDPFKNREEADSIVIRERIWEQFNEVVFTRLEGASVIVVHTRWHEDDLIGRLKDGGWEVINFPAIAEGSDDLGRKEGDALWPDRFDSEELGNIKRQIGDFSFSALYQGSPRPRGSNLFREPARFRLPQTPEEWRDFLAGKRLVIGVDPAASERTHADYSVAVVMAKDALGSEANTWILRVVRRQATIPIFVADLRALQKYWKALLVVEAAGGFKAVPQMLRHVDPHLRIVEVHPTRDKFTRAQGVAAAWNDGRVFVPTGDSPELEWVDAFMQEVLSFSGVKDPHDDQVDAMAHGWNALSEVPRRRKRGMRINQGSFG